MPDFNDVLNKKASDVSKPKAKPAGTYLASLVGVPAEKTAKTQDGDKTILSFKAKLMVPQEDVSQDALADHPTISDWPPMNYDLWLTEDLWGLKRFLTDVLGIDPGPEDNSKSFKEMIGESAGRQLLVTLEHKPYTDKATGQPDIAANITKTARV